MVEDRKDKIWKTSLHTHQFLSWVRSAIPMAQEQINIMRQVILSNDKRVDHFLDIGCGDGTVGASLFELFPEANGTFLDFSDPMLKAAKDKLEPMACRCHFLKSDYATPTWCSHYGNTRPFDAIVSGYSIHHQPDKRKKELYAELYELLTHDGWFINIEHVKPATDMVTTLFENETIDALYQIELENGKSRSREEIAIEFNSRDDKTANILTPVETQCQWLRDIGFKDVDCYFKIYELAVFGGRRQDEADQQEISMSEYFAQIEWNKVTGEAFIDNKYSRAHTWLFDGGLEIPASSSPQVVPTPYSVEANVDPEEAFVAALSSCHMLWFLSLAANKKHSFIAIAIKLWESWQKTVKASWQ